MPIGEQDAILTPAASVKSMGRGDKVRKLTTVTVAAAIFVCAPAPAALQSAGQDAGQTKGAAPGAPPAQDYEPTDNEPADYFYFSKAGIAAEQAGADWDECRDLVGTIRGPVPDPVYYYNPGGAAGMAAAAAVGFVQGFIRAGQRRHMINAGIRKCMQVKGYARYAMTKDEAKLVYDGKWEDIRARLVEKAVAPADEAQRLEP
ncbi:hypothetical protein GVO57_05695 [Sphingomonas changnyeongensis]|uniref:Uncharacterized protein n=1 Tax=Sphingomonas changnyeongensis TaxID=2698679 RepID=A0A7Z2NV79_9SPHN|nr:hypothetical protein [Sphingomonas changnyeongensis]QHL90423.1 hypothetical protein GVO57_05695 [Sphingomonas changnyeongensis]